jgi:Uma2 family endonuclease
MADRERPRPTVADVIARLHAGESIELIDGEVVPRELSRPAHGRVQIKVGAMLDPFHRRTGGPRGPGGWWLMTEVEVLYPHTGEVFRHDVVGFRRDRLAECPTAFPASDSAGVLATQVAEGSGASPRTAAAEDASRRNFGAHSDRPDWACEVLSRSTARFDLVKKQRTLHAHGVPHYWLIDPEQQTLIVYRHGADGYVNVLSAEPGETVRAEPFDAIELDVAELLGGEG